MLNTLSSPQAAQNQEALFESVLLSILLSLFFLDFNLGFFELILSEVLLARALFLLP